MQHASFRFYAELNDFLPEVRRHKHIAHYFEKGSSVREMIESFGVPHGAIDLILVNDQSVDFSYPVRDGDRVAVYPVFETFDISVALRVRPHPLREIRFVLDARLGKLTWYLRLLGFDAVFHGHWSDEKLAVISLDENRILLTRDCTLIERSQITHGYQVRRSRPRQQAVEVVRRFDLRDQIAPFRRCTQCNALLEATGRRWMGEDSSGKMIGKGAPRQPCTGRAHLRWSRARTERARNLIRSIIEGALRP